MDEPWAPLYYQTHDGIDGDVQFYRNELGAITRVLDLGCGIGRLSKQFVSWGHDVCALDRSQFGLQSLHDWSTSRELTSRITCIRADFTALPVVHSFPRIVLSFNGFLCLGDDEKRTFLQAVKSRLAVDGLLLMDLYDGECFETEDTDEVWVYEPELVKSIPLSKRTYHVYQSGCFYPAEGRIKMTYDHFLDDDDEPEKRLHYTIDHFPISESRLLQLIDQVGLEVRALKRQQIDDNVHLFLSVGVRA